MRKKLTASQLKQKRHRYYVKEKTLKKGWEIVKNYENNIFSSFKDFKNNVEGQMTAHDLSLKDAIKKVQNYEVFVPKYLRGRRNILNALKEEYPTVYKQVIEISREYRNKGKYVSLVENLTWDKDKNSYILHGKDGKAYKIDTTPSPKAVFLVEI